MGRRAGERDLALINLSLTRLGTGPALRATFSRRGEGVLRAFELGPSRPLHDVVKDRLFA